MTQTIVYRNQARLCDRHASLFSTYVAIQLSFDECSDTEHVDYIANKLTDTQIVCAKECGA